MRFLRCVALLVAAFLGQLAFGLQEAPDEEAKVTIRGGRSVVGLVIAKTDEGVRLRVDGRELFVPQQDIVFVEDLPPIEERYRAQLAKIGPADTELRLVLAEWLRDRERYALALNEAEAVLSTDSANQRARRLAGWLRAQLVLENRTRARNRNPAEGSEPNAPKAPARSSKEDPGVTLLTPDQVNLIRVYEIDLGDPPKMVIPRSTIEQFFVDYADHPLVPRDEDARRAIIASRPARQLDLMFRAQARELYADVKVMDDPTTLETFRQRIHGRWLVRACASNGCHGGAEAGRLRFATDRPNKTETVYTNFLILERFRLRNGEPLIDHLEAESSAFLRAGLRAEDATLIAGDPDSWTHPEIPPTRSRRGWRPIFRGPDDDRYAKTVAWIRSLYRPRPEHPITFDPVWAAPTVGDEEETER
ncbi:MAG: hypothetical protein AAGI53_07550 [Planctomycetota bacterium]